MKIDFKTVLTVIVVSLVVYGLAYRFLYWQVPRRHPHIPGIVMSVLAGLLGAALTTHLQLGDGRELGAAALGAGIVTLLVFYLVVKIGTPFHAGVVINCEAASEYEAGLDEEYKPPFAWPYQFIVGKEGFVTWDLRGPEGCRVRIEFPADNNPFGNDREGKPRNVFEGVVPSSISVGPVVKSGRGEYKVIRTDRAGHEVTADPGWDSPTRHT